jgi:hypothetical protein
MAVRTWANTLGVGAGAGLLAGAGQLGIGYGLGILRWDQPFPTGDAWHAQLTWVAFFAGVAVVAGGYAGEWYARRSRLVPTLGVRVALALVSAVGAAVILPLCIRPAGLAHPAEGGDPRLSVALTCVAGLLVGIIAAFAALTVPAVSGSVVATVLWMWIAALVSAAYTLGGGASWATARLGLFPGRGIWVPLALFAPAVLIGLAVAAIARFGGSDTRAVGASGATGPALVGLAYLIAGPGSGSGGSAYRWALVAIAAGGAVSVLVAVARRPVRTATPAPAPAPAPALAPAAPIAEVPLGPEPAEESPTEMLTPIPPPAAPVSPAAPPEKPVSPAPTAEAGDETVDLGRSDPLEGVEASKISEEPTPEPAPEPETPKKGFRLGRRKKEPKEPREEALKAATPDDHLDWVNSLRATESPARVGGKGAAARHAAKPPEEKPEESEA